MDVDGALVDRVRSREELRFAYVDEQGWDASCGYAALGSLLSRYRGRSVDEEALLSRSVPGGGKAVVKVSLAELIRLVRSVGLEARPWKMPFEALPGVLAASAPVLVHYDRPQGHFALVLSVGPQGVVTADPARGLELLTRSQFLARWSGVVLEVVDPAHLEAGAETVEKAVNTAWGRAEVVRRALSKARRTR